MLWNKSRMFREAHKLTKKFIKEAKTKLDYRFQFGLCVSFYSKVNKVINEKLNNVDSFTDVGISDWFLRKNFSSNEKYAISVARKVVVKGRTEKAVKLQFMTEFGNIVSWFPKSVIEWAF